MTWTRGRITTAVVLGVAVALLATVSFVVSQRATLSVTVTPSRLQCDGVGPLPYLLDATRAPSPDDVADEVVEPGFQLVDDGSTAVCDLTLDVTNHGQVPVTIRAAVVDGWADTELASGSFVADDSGRVTRPETPDGEDTAARWAADERIGQDETGSVTIGFTRRQESCRDVGAFMTWVRPRLELSSLGWRTSVDSRITVASWTPASTTCSSMAR